MAINQSNGVMPDFHHEIPSMNGGTLRQNGDFTQASLHAFLDEAPKSGRLVLDSLYSSKVYAKIWNVASRALTKSQPPTLYPEYTKPGGTKYVYRELDFWTSGFFPGCLYLLLERERKYKGAIANRVKDSAVTPHLLQLEFACQWWSVNLHQNASLSTTHDLGFMIFPWARQAWELNHDVLAYDTIVRASRTLASRYVGQVGAIRSWDTCITKRYAFTNPKKDFLLIIDNMMNLDMLFWTASQLNDREMYHIAYSHARKTQQFHVRANNSTAHLTVFDPDTGALKETLTNQGFSDTSSWTRGQAWAITGFVQTYNWTQDLSFLETARSCAEYFWSQLPPDGIPPWDFSAPKDSVQPPDTSAAIIAVYGMLLIHEAHSEKRQSSVYFDRAIHILRGICSHYMNLHDEFAVLSSVLDTVERVPRAQMEVRVKRSDTVPETILGGATINNYEFAPRRWANHGLVYADYYFLLVGNKLLEMRAMNAIDKTNN